eukprot:c12976_g1_i2.p1 GENE.c12976_g1_i2~~c12976_g1_i2.p1  ORF type:complete len:1619 (+),score=400.81 c12976_g1_i2:36-4859(+)
MALVVALVLAIAAVCSADFALNFSNITSQIKQYGENATSKVLLSLPFALQGSASFHMCGCFFPPCASLTYNFTCGLESSLGGIPTLFHPPIVRNSEVVLSPANQWYRALDVGEVWRYGSVQNTSTNWHEPLSTANNVGNIPDSAGDGITCSISSTNVTCKRTSGSVYDYEVMCLIPEYSHSECENRTSSVTSVTASSWAFPPCMDSRVDCGVSTTTAHGDGWWNIYRQDRWQQLTYGDSLNRSQSFSTFSKASTSLLKVACSGKRIDKRIGSGLETILDFGWPSLTSGVEVDNSMNLPLIDGLITGQVCWVPVVASGASKLIKNITFPIPINGDTKYINFLLDPSKPTTFANAINTIVNTLGSANVTAENILNYFNYTLPHFQMAQVGLEPSSLTNVTVWMALTHLRVASESATDDPGYSGTVCFTPPSLICAPLNSSLEDNQCARHDIEVDNFVTLADQDTIISSDASGKSAQQKILTPKEQSQKLRHKSLQETTTRDVVNEWVRQATDISRMDDGTEPPGYLAQMFQKGDFDEESIDNADKNEITRHTCSSSGSVSTAYCLNIRDSDSGGSSVACRQGNIWSICPLSYSGTSNVISDQLAVANSSAKYRNENIFKTNHTHIEISLDCSFRVTTAPIHETDLSLELEALTSFFSSVTAAQPDEASLYAARNATEKRFFFAVVILISTSSSSVEPFHNQSTIESFQWMVATALETSMDFVYLTRDRVTYNSDQQTVQAVVWVLDDSINGWSVSVLKGALNNATSSGKVSKESIIVNAEVTSLTLTPSPLPYSTLLSTAKQNAVRASVFQSMVLAINETYDIECSFIVSPETFATKSAAPTIKSLTLLTFLTANRQTCISPFLDAVCGTPILRRIPDALWGNVYDQVTLPQGHVTQYLTSNLRAPLQCNGIALRLTSPAQFKVGTAWHHTPQHIISGFSSTIRFQFTSPSNRCTTARMIGTQAHLYTNCVPDGGDGFAFVIKGLSGVFDDPKNFWMTNANDNILIGSDGGGIGYSGIPNSLVVEFDSRHNPDSLQVGVDLIISISEFDAVITSDVLTIIREATVIALRNSHLVTDIKFQEALKTAKHNTGLENGLPEVQLNSVSILNYHILNTSKTANTSHSNSNKTYSQKVVFEIHIDANSSATTAYSILYTIQEASPFSFLQPELETLFNSASTRNILGYVPSFTSTTVEESSIFSSIAEPSIAHVAVHSVGRGMNSGKSRAQLIAWALPPSEFPEGFGWDKEHVARIEFVPELNLQNVLRSQPPTPQSMHLMGTVRDFQPPSIVNRDSDHNPDNRIPQTKQGGIFRTASGKTGVLNVFLDDMSLPLFSLPIDLENNLDLFNGTAAIGLTAATGRRWQESHILEWDFCEGSSCGQWRASKTSTCKVGQDFSKVRQHRNCNFWNTWEMWSKNNSMILEAWKPLTSDVYTDESQTPRREFMEPYSRMAVDLSDCVAFRQTAQCSFNGTRQPSRDLSCHNEIQPYMTGYCECNGSRIVAAVDCGHVPFKCEIECMGTSCLGFQTLLSNSTILDESFYNCTHPISQYSSGFCDCRGGVHVTTDRIVPMPIHTSGLFPNLASRTNITCFDVCGDVSNMGIRHSELTRSVLR